MRISFLVLEYFGYERFVSHLTRIRSATAGGSELCFTLNYHLSTLNFLSTTASGWLQRLVRCFACKSQRMCHRNNGSDNSHYDGRHRKRASDVGEEATNLVSSVQAQH